MSEESNPSVGQVHLLTKKGCLDRFSLDRIEFTCRKLRAAAAKLDGHNLRHLSSLRLEDVSAPYTGVQRDQGGLVRADVAAAFQRYLRALAGSTFTIVVDGFSDPITLKNGVTGATGKLDWHFVDPSKAVRHFVGLLRNASVQQLQLTSERSHKFLQALSLAQVEIAVGTLTVKNFEPEAENLELSREALMSFSRLGELMIDAVPPDFLNDYFLLAAAQKHVTSITFESHGSYVLVLPGGAAPTFRQIRVALGSEVNYPEFCDGIVAFLFRVDLDESTKVELRFPAARIPYDFCLKLMQSAISAGTRYSIKTSFVAMNDVSGQLVGFEEHRRLDGNCVIYEVPHPSVTNIVVELVLTAVQTTEIGGAARTFRKLIEFRRYSRSDP
ncbi:hypothetical protein AAVH_16829 [Aphelenchoides avenae]|nr:hypothetical protein AAVH_16829 [Aphelenchus avenae]